MDAKQAYQAGVQAVKQGNIKRGKQLLQHSLLQDKENIMAWLWFAKSQTDPDKRLKCIERALNIDSHHAAANKMYDLYISEYNNHSTAVATQSPVKSQKSNTHNDEGELGKVMLRSSMNIPEQLFRLLMMVLGFLLSGVLLTSGFGADRMKGFDVIRDWITAITTQQTPQGDQSRVLLLIIFVICFGFLGIYGFVTFLTAFGERLTIYEHGYEHNFFGMKKQWLWRDIKQAKLSETRTVIRQGLIAIPITTYKLQLKSKKGNFSLGKQYGRYRELGEYMLQQVKPYVDIMDIR